MSKQHKVAISKLIVDDTFHERSELNPDAIKRYKEMYEHNKQKAIIVDKKTMKVIDGVHRVTAAKEAGTDSVYVKYVDLHDSQMRAEAYQYNRLHGIPYSTAERNEVIWKLRRKDGWAEQEIADLVGLSQGRVSQIVTSLDSNKGYDPEEAATKEEEQPVIIRRILKGETHESIAEDYKVSRSRISTIWGSWKQRASDLYTAGNLKLEVASELGLTINETDKLLMSLVKGDYEPINFEPTYSSWWPPFGIDERYGQKHPGNIPAKLVQNILYFYTMPGDHIVDPCTGGAVVIDVCKDMVGRTCEGFDIDPKREDIKKHNLLDSIPPTKKDPDFILFDPPYGLVASGKYDGGVSDLSEIQVDSFISVWTEILERWENCRLAFLMAGLRRESQYYDLPMMIGESLEKAGWTILERIVNGIGQTASDNALWEKKEKEERLILHRHIDIWVAQK